MLNLKLIRERHRLDSVTSETTAVQDERDRL
jgi:hypothetical protein